MNELKTGKEIDPFTLVITGANRLRQERNQLREAAEMGSRETNRLASELRAARAQNHGAGKDLKSGVLASVEWLASHNWPTAAERLEEAFERGDVVVATLERPPMNHDLKCWPEPFRLIKQGKKTHEIRVNDRDYRVMDKLHLNEYDPSSGGVYTGDELFAEVTALTPGGQFGLPQNVVVMSIKVVP